MSKYINADTDNNPAEQQNLYRMIMAQHKLVDIRSDLDWWKNPVQMDWLQVASIDGIDYYTPNNEDWGQILAVSIEHRLAHYTSFYEMDDMGDEVYTDYRQVVHNGAIVCTFEAEPVRQADAQ